MNAEAVACTNLYGNPLANSRLGTLGRNILLFEFEDTLDVERVLEFKPWSYDKHLVVFERVVDVETAPLLVLR